MPIPHLVNKVHSPQSWRQESPRQSNRNYRPPMNSGRSSKKSGIKKFLSVVLMLGALFFLGLGFGGTFIFFLYSRDLPNPNKFTARLVSESTKIYDREKKVLLFEIYGDEKRTRVELNQISPFLIKATLAAEDKDFYKHGGFDWRALLRALFVNIKNLGNVQGGSTITQQLVKNSILSREKTLQRKLKELVFAIELERKFTKNQILTMYLNEIPYGSSLYGVEATSQALFGKKTIDLTLSEAALIASLPKAPTYYSPYGTHPDDLLARWRYVLDLMTDNGFITKAEAAEAKKINILAEIKPKKENIMAPHFVLYVKELLAQKYGDQQVERGGLIVTTSLDVNKQKLAEKALDDNRKNIENFGASNAALVSLDPKTGQILAMVGSMDYFDKKIDGNVNVALRPRQPGSSFKPIVYTASFINGYTPSTILFDVNTTFKTVVGDYTPHNYNQKVHGPVTVRQALAGSLNIPAVKMIYLTGINNVLDLADKMGYSTLKDRSRFGLSLVLGGGEVTLLEHTNAFGVLANEGIYHPPVSILKVENSKGEVLEEVKDFAGEKVIEPEITHLTTDILKDNEARSFIFGQHNFLTLLNRPVATKTGTTNDFHDAWTLGYTPSLVTGVWVGNNNNDAMKESADGSRIAAPIWQGFMSAALKDTPVDEFNAPTPIVTGKPILDGEPYPSITVKLDKFSGNLATDVTPASAIEEKSFPRLHDTLFYINKDDPRGPEPVNPSGDEQFANWEQAVFDWAKENNISFPNPPSDFDATHKTQDKIGVIITSPQTNAQINNNSFTVNTTISAPRGVKKVEYYLANKLMGTAVGAMSNFVVQVPSDVPSGFYTLKVVAYDDLENVGVAEVPINYSPNP